MIRRLARGLGYWWAAVCYVLIPPSLRKVSPRHDPTPGGTNAPPGAPDHPRCRCVLVPNIGPVAHCPECRCALYSEADKKEHATRHRVQRLIVRPMVQRGEVIRGGDPATGKVNMWLTEKGEGDLT